MVHGHPHSFDDAILESGNRNAKRGKSILFWGGTEERDPDDPSRRASYVQDRATGKRGSDGEMLFKQVRKQANASVEVQHLKNTLLRQILAMRRSGTDLPTAKRQATAKLKAEMYAKQCDGTEAALGGLLGQMAEPPDEEQMAAAAAADQ